MYNQVKDIIIVIIDKDRYFDFIREKHRYTDAYIHVTTMNSKI